MEDIKSLVSLLTLQKIKQIEIITEDAEMSPKTRELFEGIREGKFKTDNEAAASLYNSDENNAAYRKLKYRLKQRLINTLFFIDVQAYSKSNYQKAYGKAMKNWAAFKILLDKGARSSAINLAENILKSTLKYDLIELSILIVKDLKMHFGIFDNNNYKFEKYCDLFEELKKTDKLRDEAEDLYIRLGRIITQTKNYTVTDEIVSLEIRVNELLNDVCNLDSFYLRYYSYNAAFFLYLIKSDIDSQLIISQEAIEYFKDKKGFKKTAIFSFTQSRGIALLGKRDYDSAQDAFHTCLKMLSTKEIVTSQYLNNYLFTTHILKFEYQKAYEILSEVINQSTFKSLPENFREPWYLKEAYIHFLINTGKVIPNNSEVEQLRSFRLTRFMNEMPVFAKDKRGLNITINIIQMLFLIVEEKFDDVLDKLTALRQYNFRYLKRPEYNRSSNFIKMLLKIPEGDYRAKTIRKKAEKHYQALLDNPSDFSEHALSLEIIPYEQLWDEILSMFPE